MATGRGARQHRVDGPHERADVLGLVVGGEDEPGLAGHGPPYPSDRPWPRISPTAEIAAAFDELARPLRARRRDRPPGGRLPQRRQGGARRVGLGRPARRLGARDRACRDRRDAPGEDPGARWTRATSPPPSACARSSLPASSRSRACPGWVPSARAGSTRRWASTRWRRCARPPSSSACATCKGFGPKAEENILTALAAAPDGAPRERLLLDRALGTAEPHPRRAARAPRRPTAWSWRARRGV